MVSFVNYWYNKKNMLGELIFVVACFKEALRDFRDHPEYPGPIHPLLLQPFLPDSHGDVDILFRPVDHLRAQDRERKRAHSRSIVLQSMRHLPIHGPIWLTCSA
jgi:hypothetical protein